MFVSRALKIVFLLGLVLAGGALAYAGAQPEGFHSVGEVARAPASFAGKEVDLKASVVEGSIQRNATATTFRIADGTDTLLVRWDPTRPLPDQEAGGTIEGKNVVVKGLLKTGADGVAYVESSEMQVGCASKYRPA